MFKKISLLLAAIIIFSCSQALAAADVKPIFNGDEKAFINTYNDVAKKLGLTTYKKEPSQQEGDVFSFELTENADSAFILIQRKGKSITKCGLLTVDKALAEKTFKAWLMVCGLTDAEINVEPVFNADDTNVKLYCAALKGNVDVKTFATEGENKEMFYTVIVAGDEQK
ncbi:MAG: hypothetical protein IJS29_07510 [Selenomonadaceae bacterium]|nr:hypothetical protein [Selenomonadaceae bacterium]